jgi:aryl-alcohol dehydrogenase-like predicted oxidoreductase
MTYGDPGRGHPVWSLNEEQSRPLIKLALEVGINFFDTANMYSHDLALRVEAKWSAQLLEQRRELALLRHAQPSEPRAECVGE